ncbi:hypothetical protein H5J25_13865 [Sphingomonas aliaeris]|uniref:Uncharacterized protein n=1 Tax=Sphingomonas aliaeris TaxID=2759526 RepID=A0A974NTB0_9SPHN|nr:hypothetical protein [Sphingomonas aliaeris]QQV76530.1 hypothetical protein H5J25_13865 [Sphingomonas aliaeris]
MDAKSLKVAPTATIHVNNAAGEPLYDDGKKVQIKIHGPGSRPFSAVEARQSARFLKRMNDNDGKMTAPTADERRQELAEDLAEVTIEFENLTYDDKTGSELFQAVYADPELGYIPAQINKKIKDWGNFLPKSNAI